MAELKQKQNRIRLREMNETELHHEIAAMRASLYMWRQQNKMKQLVHTTQIRDARRQIARALTILRERELDEQRGAK